MKTIIAVALLTITVIATGFVVKGRHEHAQRIAAIEALEKAGAAEAAKESAKASQEHWQKLREEMDQTEKEFKAKEQAARLADAYRKSGQGGPGEKLLQYEEVNRRMRELQEQELKKLPPKIALALMDLEKEHIRAISAAHGDALREAEIEEDYLKRYFAIKNSTAP
ncbi:MAG: hypothetical protein PHQ12_04660 [Chthoniobacteraceae bacterium]|nr:hypothetical protein [Chthoniobacteraceae bacterium]